MKHTDDAADRQAAAGKADATAKSESAQANPPQTEQIVSADLSESNTLDNDKDSQRQEVIQFIPLAPVTDAATLLLELIAAWQGWLPLALIPYMYWIARLYALRFFYVNPTVRLVLTDYIAAIAIFAVAPTYHWLGPTLEAKLFSLLVLLCAVWIFVLIRLNANPLAEAVGSRERTSLAGVVGILAVLVTLLPIATNAKTDLASHNPPNLPSQLIGFGQTDGTAVARYLEPLWVVADGGAFYGGSSSPYFFSVIAWTDGGELHNQNSRLGAQMFEGTQNINIAGYTCADNWTGRAGADEINFLHGAYDWFALFGIDIGKTHDAPDGPPLLRSFQDTSPQARYFWHLGPTPANEKLPPPQSVGCGVYRGGINMLVIFFKTQDGGVPPPPLAVSQVFDKLFSFYRL